MTAHPEWITDATRAALDRLTPKQAAGAVRLAAARLEGRGVNALLSGADRICASTTYYGRGGRGGWHHSKAFQAALAAVESDLRAHTAQHVLAAALAGLRRAAPDAVAELHRQVVGDAGALDLLAAVLRDGTPAQRVRAAEALGAANHARAVAALAETLAAAQDDALVDAAISALGRLAAAQNADARAAAGQVLDRAGLDTAAKAPPGMLQIVYVEDDAAGQTAGAGDADD